MANEIHSVITKETTSKMASGTEFLVKPNASFHRSGWKWVVALLAIVALSIAVRFAWLGYWVVLPFAIIDIVAVTLIFLMIVRKSAYIEKIVVNQNDVEIHHIERNNNASWQFPLHWIQINLEAPSHRWYPHRLLLGSKGQWVEVGGCLTDDERQSLAEALKQTVKQTARVTVNQTQLGNI